MTHSKTETAINDGSGDVITKWVNRYRDSDRVNDARLPGVVLMGSPAPGHSYANAYGYADAGVDTRGGYTNMGGYARALAGEFPSTAYAKTRTKIQFTWVVGPGASGAAVGDPVTDLRWEFGTHGFLSVQGTTWPQTTNNAATMDFESYIERGPNILCSGFPCPAPLRAAEIDYYAALQAVSRAPALPDDHTGEVWRYLDWDAWSNAEGASGEPGAWVLSQAYTLQDALISGVVGVDTGEDIDYLDFDATVGETLKLTATLEVFASVGGVGEAQADFMETFAMRIYDPQNRGYSLSFAVRPIPEPATWLIWLAGLTLVWLRRSV